MFNYNHYMSVIRARSEWNAAHPNNQLPVYTDFNESYDRREGNYITGDNINTKHHPLHNMVLVHNKTGERYEIDIVCKHWCVGWYWYLVYTEVSSGSHGTLFWENISCHDKNVLDSIEESRKEFRLEPLIH